jgi:hypothetical protein
MESILIMAICSIMLKRLWDSFFAQGKLISAKDENQMKREKCLLFNH